MESSTKRNKGGRPPKAIKHSEQLSALCTPIERSIVEGKAKAANMSVSEFLRRIALDGKIIVKSYPREILKISAQLNHLAANIYNISKRLNYNQSITAEEQELLRQLPESFKGLSEFIKSKLQ